MKKIMMIACLLLALSSTAQAGDCPTCGAAAPVAPESYGPRAEKSEERFGLLPCLRWNLFSRKKADSCSACETQKSPCFRHGGCHSCAPQAAPQQLQGTLVFPVNPFIRSPRDFFMGQ